MATTASTVPLTFSWGSPASAHLRGPASSRLPTNTETRTCLYQRCICDLLHPDAAAQRMGLEGVVVLPWPSSILVLPRKQRSCHPRGMPETGQEGPTSRRGAEREERPEGHQEVRST